MATVVEASVTGSGTDSETDCLDLLLAHFWETTQSEAQFDTWQSVTPAYSLSELLHDCDPGLEDLSSLAQELSARHVEEVLEPWDTRSPPQAHDSTPRPSESTAPTPPRALPDALATKFGFTMAPSCEGSNAEAAKASASNAASEEGSPAPAGPIPGRLDQELASMLRKIKGMPELGVITDSSERKGQGLSLARELAAAVRNLKTQKQAGHNSSSNTRVFAEEEEVAASNNSHLQSNGAGIPPSSLNWRNNLEHTLAALVRRIDASPAQDGTVAAPPPPPPGEASNERTVPRQRDEFRPHRLGLDVPRQQVTGTAGRMRRPESEAALAPEEPRSTLFPVALTNASTWSARKRPGRSDSRSDSVRARLLLGLGAADQSTGEAQGAGQEDREPPHGGLAPLAVPTGSGARGHRAHYAAVWRRDSAGREFVSVPALLRPVMEDPGVMPPVPSSPWVRDLARTKLVQLGRAHAQRQHGTVKGLIRELWQIANPKGCFNQRLVCYVLNALNQRATGASLPYLNHLSKTPEVTKESIFEFFTRIGWAPFAAIANTYAFVHALWGHSKLHIILFADGLGVCWSTLFRALANQPGGAPAVRVTNFRLCGATNCARATRSCPETEVEAEARSFGVPLVYNTICLSPELFDPDLATFGEDEAVAVGACWHLSVFPDSRVVRFNPRMALLKWLRRLQPKVFVLLETDADVNESNFGTRFEEVLARRVLMLEQWDAVTPTSCEARTAMEFFTMQLVTEGVAYEGLARFVRDERMEQWFHHMHIAGFELCAFPEETFDAWAQLSLANEHFGVSRAGKVALWGIQGIPNLFASAWVPTL